MTTDLRSVRRAEVYKAGRSAATLTRGDGSVTFAYLDDYDGPPVAHGLPRDSAPVVTYGGAVPPFFAGLLPEGRRLAAVQRAAKTSADDDLTLLLMVGSDTIGDVTVFPEGADPTPAAPALAASDLGQVRFSELLAEAGFADRRGVPGVQEKLSTGMITLPVRFAGAEAIVKLDPPDYPDAVVNEAFFLDVARRLKQPVADAEIIHDQDGRAGLLVRRFDRVPSAQGVRSLAVEDATQLLGRYPADKYNLSSTEVAQAIADACPARPVAARATFQQFVLAWRSSPTRWCTSDSSFHAVSWAGSSWSVSPWTRVRRAFFNSSRPR